MFFAGINSKDNFLESMAKILTAGHNVLVEKDYKLNKYNLFIENYGANRTRIFTNDEKIEQ